MKFLLPLLLVIGCASPEKHDSTDLDLPVAPKEESVMKAPSEWNVSAEPPENKTDDKVHVAPKNQVKNVHKTKPKNNKKSVAKGTHNKPLPKKVDPDGL